MSLSLTLLPFGPEYGDYSQIVLKMTDMRGLEDSFGALPLWDVPAEFNTYCATREDGEKGYGQTSEDAYGEPLKYTYAQNLNLLLDLVRVERGLPWNVAAMAYVAALPPDWKVALYWE